MYIVAFTLAYFFLKKQYKEGALNENGKETSEDDLFSFLFTGILCLIIGARVFSTLVYDTSGTYWKKPWLIFWPFDTKTGQFTGLAGMSYHGGFIGGLLGMIIWCAIKKRSVWKWIDAMVVAIPLGYTFGRLGNFMNGELYGRITTMPWGMVFPHAEKFSTNLDWVKDFMQQIGMTTTKTFVNLPRHPSQLYEAFFEGIVTFLILWAVHRKKPWDGFLGGLYTLCYGTFRFFIEYFREPDADLGYRITSDPSAEIWKNTSLLNISTGQILCFLMIAGGIGVMIGTYFWQKHKDKKLTTSIKTEKK